MDEQLDLVTVRSADPSAIFGQIRGVLGAAPLPQLLQWACFRMFGPSDVAGRLPSAIASIAACIGLFLLARRAGLTRPTLAVLVFAAIPLQLRYAIEARGYALGLCFSVWASVALLRLMDADGSSLKPAGLYALMLTAALYAQPYAGFVAAPHWIFGMHRGSRRSKVALTVAILFATLAFLPWYLWASPWWRQIIPLIKGAYSFDPHSTLVVLHELVGMGYPGSVLMLGGAAVGAAWRMREPSRREFWLLYALVPIAAALLADAAFHYFLAVRQILFILTPLSILFTAGIEAATKYKRTLGLLLALVFFAGAIYGNIRFFHRPRPSLPELELELRR